MEKKNKQQKKGVLGEVRPLLITEEMQNSYISYAMSVIVSRALPDIRDGLKPVQRRILFTMHSMGLSPGGSFRKSATVVGNCIGNYHPHGDSAVYEAMVRMAQDFSLRYPLVKPQGNFGSIDSDPPAAQRYTEAKLSKLGAEMLKDIEKDTVDHIENFDGTKKEPVVLPSPMPQLLLNGCLGIAVGMATNIPPHNLNEVCDAAAYLVDHPKATTEDLFQFIQGPDFPTGGIIYDREGIIEAYSQGKGSIVVRARTEIVNSEDRPQIIINEIPFGVNKFKLLQKIAKLVEDKKLKGIKDIRDESDQNGLRVVIELKRGTAPKRVLNFLYKWTQLQHKFHLNMVALVDGIQPKCLDLVEVLEEFIKHRKLVIERRSKFEKEKAEARVHILEGFEIAIANIDDVISTIKKSKDRENAKKNLIKKFELSELQAEAILNMRLSSLAKMERDKIEEELKQKKAKIKQLQAILESPKKRDALLKDEIKDIKERFGDERRTSVFKKKVGEILPEDLIPNDDVIVVLTQDGMVKRVKPQAYRAQRRGGKGVIGANTKEEDIVDHMVFANTQDDIFFFTDSGTVFKTKVYEIPAAERSARGENIMNFLQLSSNEKILAVLPLKKTENKKNSYFVIVTEKGRIKKTDVGDFNNVRRNGLIAITLKKGDLLKHVERCSKGDDVVLVTKKGKAIRFNEKGIRSMGRSAMGVKGIDLDKGDEVISMDIVREKGGELLIIMENGYGKRTKLSEYRRQKRGGKGLKAANLTKKTGDVAVARIISGKEESIVIISQKAQVIKTRVREISVLGRVTQGVKVINLKEGDAVASISCF